MKTRLKAAAAAVLVAGSLGAGSARAQGIPVFDAANLTQTIQQAINGIAQINNQIQQIQNQATSLINEARNLASLPVSTIQTLQQQVDQTRQLLNQAQRIAYDVTDVQQVFNGRYKGAALTGGQAQMVPPRAMKSSMSALGHGMSEGARSQ